MIKESFPGKKAQAIFLVPIKKRPGLTPAWWEFQPKRV
jgi:hypothetical protein